MGGNIHMPQQWRSLKRQPTTKVKNHSNVRWTDIDIEPNIPEFKGQPGLTEQVDLDENSDMIDFFNIILLHI